MTNLPPSNVFLFFCDCCFHSVRVFPSSAFLVFLSLSFCRFCMRECWESRRGETLNSVWFGWLGASQRGCGCLPGCLPTCVSLQLSLLFGMGGKERKRKKGICWEGKGQQERERERQRGEQNGFARFVRGMLSRSPRVVFFFPCRVAPFCLRHKKGTQGTADQGT